MIRTLALVRDFEVRPRAPTALETALGAAEIYDVWDRSAPDATPSLRVVARTVTGVYFCGCPARVGDCEHVAAARSYQRIMGHQFQAAFQ